MGSFQSKIIFDMTSQKVILYSIGVLRSNFPILIFRGKILPCKDMYAMPINFLKFEFSLPLKPWELGFVYNSCHHSVILFCFIQLSKESFSPCMRNLHESLRKEHHLRHFGRLQYGLFLKSIGITLDQALEFWRSEFTKKMEPDKVEFRSAILF